MKKGIFYWIFVMLLLKQSITIASAQDGNEEISFKNFNHALLAKLILDKVNHTRDSLGIHPLDRDSILELAAVHHVNYVRKTDNLDHSQDDPKMGSLETRVEFYKGTHEKLAENIDKVYVGKPTTIYKEKTPIKVTNYNDAAYFFVKSCINNGKFLEILTDKKLYHSGIGFSLNAEEKCIYIVQVFGSKHFKFHHSVRHKDNKKIFYPSKKANIDNAYELKPFDLSTCEKCITRYHNIPDHVQMGILVDNSKVYFVFNDMETFEKTFPDGDEAIAVDLVHKSQFPCETDNTLHRSFAFDGILFNPLTKADLLKKNIKKDGSGIQAQLGEVPQGHIPGEYEYSMLLIKANTVCKYFTNTPPVDNKRLILENNQFTDTTDQSELLKKKTLRFSIPFEKGKYEYSEEDLIPFYDSLQLNKFNIKEVIVFAYSSVEGSTESNLALQKKRAESIVKVLQSFQLDTIKKVIQTFESWDQFYRSIKNTPFAYLSKLTKEEIKEKLKQDSLVNALEKYLKYHRKAVLLLKIEEKIDLNERRDELARLYISAIARKDLKSATIIQSSIYSGIENNYFTYELIDSVQIPKTKEFAQIINNDIIFRYRNNLKGDFIKELEVISALDPSNIHIKYNIYDLTLKAWEKDPNFLSSPEGLIKNIKTLYNTKIDKQLVNRLYINYYILISSYYRATGKHKYSSDAVSLVKKYYKTVNLGPHDILALANFFSSFKRDAWALEILFPYIQNNEEVSEDMLFYFLSLAIGNTDLFDSSELTLIYMQKAREMNPVRFCNLYGTPKLKFQLLRDETLKLMYCESCQKNN
jgi:uncharacterized protein YkwD